MVYTIINNKKGLVILMIQIRPVTDLQNDYNAIEKEVLESDQTMYLTKNGYGSMVMMSLEKYTELTDKPTLITSGLNTNPKKEHIEIISKSRKIVDDDDE